MTPSHTHYGWRQRIKGMRWPFDPRGVQCRKWNGIGDPVAAVTQNCFTAVSAKVQARCLMHVGRSHQPQASDTWGGKFCTQQNNNHEKSGLAGELQKHKKQAHKEVFLLPCLAKTQKAGTYRSISVTSSHAQALFWIVYINNACLAVAF